MEYLLVYVTIILWERYERNGKEFGGGTDNKRVEISHIVRTKTDDVYCYVLKYGSYLWLKKIAMLQSSTVFLFWEEKQQSVGRRNKQRHSVSRKKKKETYTKTNKFSCSCYRPSF